MVESFADEGSLSFATLQARMKKNSFSNEYLVHLNDLTSLRLGIRFSNLRFGVADRSSISLKTAVKRGRKVAEKAGDEHGPGKNHASLCPAHRPN
jgi:hypothetical protein